MGKVIRIEVPDWVDEKDVVEIISRYVESKLPYSATREEYVEHLGINVEEIVEYEPDEELRTLEVLREKAKERCRF